MKNLNEQDAKLDLNSIFEDNLNAFYNVMNAFKKGDFKELDSLLGIKADSNNLMVRRKLEILKYSLKVGIGVETNIKDAQGVTLLHIAAATGQAEVVKCLIGNGADVNAEDIYKNTPIHHAAQRGNLEVVICLIENGAICNFILKTPPKKTISNFIEFGSFLQSLCFSQTTSFVFDEKAVKNLIKQTSNNEALAKFAALTVKNYACKIGALGIDLHKIETCTILPDNFKDSLLKTLQPLIKNTQESIEVIDVESLFAFEQLNESSDYSAIENASKALGELYQQGD